MTRTEWLIRGLDLLCLLGQGTLLLHFSARLLHRAAGTRDHLIFLAAFCAGQWAAGRVRGVPGLTLLAGLLVLYGANRLLLGGRPLPAALAAALGGCIAQCSFGVIDSVSSLLLPLIVGGPLILLAAAGGMAASLALCGACCAAAQRLVDLRAGSRAALLLPAPLLFCCAAEWYLMQTAYQELTWQDDPAFLLAQAGRHTALLGLQLLGLAAVFCALFACRAAERGLASEAALRALRQAAGAQEQYLAEARAREARTRAFRHDLQNHLTVLDGLLAAGRAAEGRAYLAQLHAAADGLSPRVSTGSPVVDILLGEKLRIAEAEGIAAEVSLALPDPCAVEPPDLCVLFANALDNALAAARAADGERWIRITGEAQGAWYRLCFENSCAAGPLPPEGTGLANLRAVATRYHGALMTEKTGECFRLDLLLDISSPPDDSSRQTAWQP